MNETMTQQSKATQDEGAPHWESIRDIKARLQIAGCLELTSPANLGGEDFLNPADQPVLRDINGRPYIPGTTLAGLLRQRMHTIISADSFGKVAGEEPKGIVGLFGSRWWKEENQSPLIVDDAKMVVNDDTEIKTELRDGVAISHTTGTAKAQQKFDQEWLPVGTRFEIHFELLLPENEAVCIERINWLLSLLKDLEEGEIQIGGRSKRGFGCCKAFDWSYRMFKTSSASGLLAWLKADQDYWWKGLASGTRYATIDELIKALGTDWSGLELQNTSVPSLSIEIDLCCPGSLLIRSSGHRIQDSDAIHLHRLHQDGPADELGTPIFSGTSLGGVLRHRGKKIANTLAGERETDRVNKFIEYLFGTDETTRDKMPQASRIKVQETEIQGEPELLRHARTKIDRWRGSAFEHHLFDADAIFGSELTFRWQIQRPIPDQAELGLMLCLVKDLFTGDLPVGGETSIGRGILFGKQARIQGQLRNNNKDDPTNQDSDHVQEINIRIEGDGQGNLTLPENSINTKPYFQALKAKCKGELA